MIQRIQTLYLFFSVVALACLIFFPMAEIVAGSQSFEFELFGIKETLNNTLVMGTWPLGALIGIMITINLVVIFSYKKRELQMRLIVYNMVLTIGFLLVGFLYGKQGLELTNGNIQMEFFSIMPVIALILMILAWRGVRKDHLMLKAVERIR